MYKRIEKSVTGVGVRGANKKGKGDRERKDNIVLPLSLIK